MICINRECAYALKLENERFFPQPQQPEFPSRSARPSEVFYLVWRYDSKYS